MAPARAVRCLASALLAAAGCAGANEPALGQDLEYNAAVHAAQAARPAEIGESARIASEGEPGVPLTLRGRVFEADGRTPLAGAIVFAYHTDKTGVYRAPGKPAHTWRLKGWARADAAGRFEFLTIRPGPYPDRREAAHVHLTIFAPDGAAYHAGALLFYDDPLVPAAEIERSERAGEFGWVCEVAHDGAAQRVEFGLRLDPRQRF